MHCLLFRSALVGLRILDPKAHDLLPIAYFVTFPFLIRHTNKTYFINLKNGQS